MDQAEVEAYRNSPEARAEAEARAAAEAAEAAEVPVHEDNEWSIEVVSGPIFNRAHLSIPTFPPLTPCQPSLGW